MVTLRCSSLRVVQEPMIKLSIWNLLNIPFNFLAISHLAKRWGKASFSQNSLFGKNTGHFASPGATTIASST